MNKPFISWVGSKYKLLDEIIPHFDKRSNVCEPFVGSGSVFSNLNQQSFYINDKNEHLINLYRDIGFRGSWFYEECKILFDQEYNEQNYYTIREEFNNKKDDEFRACEKSAMFFFLMKYCFKSLCRYNKKGGFNSPFGRRNRFKFCDSYSDFIFKYDYVIGRIVKSTITNHDFDVFMESNPPAHTIYCDPPYLGSFSDYCGGGFTIKDQSRLSEACYRASNRGYKVVLSNSHNDETKRIYSSADQVIPINVKHNFNKNDYSECVFIWHPHN